MDSYKKDFTRRYRDYKGEKPRIRIQKLGEFFYYYRVMNSRIDYPYYFSTINKGKAEYYEW